MHAVHRTSVRAARTALAALLAAQFAAWAPALASPPPPATATPARARPAQDTDESLEALVAAERREAERMLRRGELRAALRVVSNLLDEEDGDPADAATRALLARCRLAEGDHDAARAAAERALRDARAGGGDLRAAALVLADLELELGRPAQALEALDRVVDGASDAVWLERRARALLALGRRDEARAALEAGAAAGADTWRRAVARAACERSLGWLEQASQTLVRADRLAREDEGQEPDVLVALADLYVEADAEVDAGPARGRSPAELYKRALELAPSHEGALLGLFALHRLNWRRQSRPAHELLDELLAANPRSIPGLVAGCATDLEDGRLVVARSRLNELLERAPGRRDVRTLEATLAWIEHRRDEARARLEALAAVDPGDATPERELGRTLCELYRFAEGRDFLRSAVERDPDDHVAWTQLGRALANTGDETAALEALRRARDVAGGRQDAWRHNMILVLQRLATDYVEREHGEHTFAWRPQADSVLSAYLVPFYAEARETFAQRYGYTPGPVRIEAFEKFQDFSVRSTGFEGFPALGVCFGPVVTSVAPNSELRGSFNWARTAYHEFSHVIHLGLSNNRCPRWITEGLATWEETARNPSWTRNMRRDLLDARANGDLIPVRELNRAFRGPRILFGYYQGGLLCEMLIAESGFPPMIRLLEAFDRGLDVDEAFLEVYDTTPEAVDRRFEAFVDERLADLRIEPRWSPARVVQLTLATRGEAPEESAARARWADDVCSLAWGHWQAGDRVDAEQALRKLTRAGVASPRAAFLRGEMSILADRLEEGRAHWQEGLALGGEDYRVRLGLGKLATDRGEHEVAREHFEAAERAFPGYDDPTASAELMLALTLRELDREDEAHAAVERWLAYNPGALEPRLEIAEWHEDAGRVAEAERRYAEANEIDPFRRSLHLRWSRVLEELGRLEEAARELEVALLVPPELDSEGAPALEGADRAALLAHQAVLYHRLGDARRAAAKAEEALALDPECAEALELRDAVQ